MIVFYWFNEVIGLVFKALIAPFRGLAPIWSLGLISLLTGVLMVWIFGKISNQSAIRRIKDKIFGNLLGVRLYQDNVGVILRLQGRILRDTFIYMRCSLVPLLVMLIPIMIIMIHLEYYYGSRPLRIGESAIVKVLVDPDVLFNRPIALEGVPEVAVETPALRINQETDWRIRGNSAGPYDVAVHGAMAEAVRKRIDIGLEWGAVSTRRLRADSAALLLFPGEAPMPVESPIQAIQVVYPAASVEFLGISTHWVVWFFVLSLVFGFLVKDWMGVRL